MKNTALAANDYYILVALVFTMAFNVNVLISTIKGGFSQHVIRLTLEESVVLGKTFLVATVLWPCANTFVKLSILDFYTKTFPNRTLYYAAWVLRILTIGYGIATVATALSICRPIAFNWDKTIVDGVCADVPKYYLSTAIINLLVDFAIVFLPMPMLWGLQMKTSRKVALTFIFGLGFGICIISILRVVAIQELDYSDVSYNIVWDTMWTVLEPTLGVINACLPMLQPVASKASNSQLFSYARSGKSTKGSGSTKQLWTASSSTRGVRSDHSKAKNFVRIPGDGYSLTDLCTTQNDISGTTIDGEHERDTYMESTRKEPVIRVKKDWDVHSGV
ncbi:uncharacterized protein BP5553_01271 [Venustampulla echinocandica]|uniref:Rhodopsin domain-containing protein n=1 Tax=Venustampulla echinocandica TaxID=2656787 RepID=A0A370U0I2_9HELO|nr:uncharacterized protein BP5553_01271 [Venustampulla echinocandica]RDL41292.1 hypothetical protein BP5553_01271 [Venustampulla echinocandica]